MAVMVLAVVPIRWNLLVEMSAGCNGQGGAVEGTEESETEKAKGEKQPEEWSE